VAHRRAKLTALGRRLLVDRILIDGMAVAHATDMAGASRQAALKWLRRFETEGESGLEDRTSRPHRAAFARQAAEGRMASNAATAAGPSTPPQRTKESTVEGPRKCR
jgi:transposase